MAQTFDAGTVWVSVVPSLKGFGRQVSSQIVSPTQQAATRAENIITRSFKKISTRTTQVAGSLPAAVQKPLPAMRVQAAETERAFEKAAGKAQKASKALADARGREERAALSVEKAEKMVERARKAGDPQRLAASEKILADKRREFSKATRDAEGVLNEYTKATAAQGRESEKLARIQGELAAAQKALPKKNPLAGFFEKTPVTAPIVRQFRALPGVIGTHMTRAQTTITSVINRIPGPVASVGASIGRGLSSAFQTASRVGRRSFDSIRSAVSGVAGAVAVAGAAVGGFIASNIGAAVQRVDTLNNFPKIMKNLGYAQEDAAAAAKKLSDRLTGLPTSLDGIMPLVQRIAPLTGNLDQAAETGLAFNNMLLASGKSMADQSRAMEQYTQMLATGKVDMMSWRTMLEVMPGQLDQMSVALLGTGSKSMDLYEALQDGTVSFQDFNNAMVQVNKEGVAGFASFEKQARDATGGIGTSFGLLRTRTVQAIGNIIDAIGVDRITAPINAVSSAISTLGKKISDFIQGGVLKEMAPKLSGVAAAAGGLLGPLSGFVKNFAGNIPLIGNVISKVLPGISGPLGVVIGLVTSMISKSKPLRDALGGAFSKIASALGGVLESLQSSGGLFEKIGDLMGMLGDAIAPVVTWVGDLAADLISLLGPALEWLSGILESAVGWIQSDLVPILQSVWEYLTVDMAPTWQRLGDSVSAAWETIKSTASVAWSFLSDVFSSIWEFLTVRLAPVWELLGTVVTTVWGMIQDAISVAWTIIQSVFNAIKSVVENVLAPVFKWLYAVVIRPVWDMIKGAISVAWTVISFIFNTIIDVITNILAPVFTWLWQNVIGPAFSFISGAVSTAWQIMSAIFDVIISVLGSVLGPAFDRMASVATAAWDMIKTGVSSAWDWVKRNVFDRISGILDAAGKAFNTFRDTVKNAFNSIKAAAAKPINFVINTVYTGGIKKAFDTIASKIGIKTRMPAVAPIAGYASGGVLPGYTPGRDVHRFYSPTGGILDLSGGEGIIRPDALRRMGGAKWLDAINRSRGRGFSPRGDTGLPAYGSFAEGGVWGHIKSFGSSLWHGATSAASFVADVIKDPVGAAVDLIITPAKNLLSQITSGMWGQIAAGIPAQLFEGIKGFFKGETDKVGGSGTGLVRQARNYLGIPYVWGGSSIPPGLDCSGLVYYSLAQMGKRVPRLTAAGYQSASTPVGWGAKRPGDLLFWGSPAWHVAIYSGGSSMVEAPKPGMSVRETGIWGSPTVGRYKYDQGGYLPPGVSQVFNGTGRPEPVFTDRQWDALKQGSTHGGDVFNIAVPEPAATAAQIVEELVSATRRRDFLGAF
ncbi:tape measure protein [Actinomyces sp. HMSC065F12]|uniref:tape measure protein n=1 Tax=Actinomyces sp. HMSC065F12 TaxID=1739479 RepID=UPI0008A61DB6|nr:tape measure protein [Actinomyces sp. HMSC065F12]OFP69840.1 hypothetical protein HMPREF2975_00155 [Actinomyces sp. HMSC065F12]